VDLEGALRIGLGVRAGRVERVRIASTRPDAARMLLQGRRRGDIREVLPRLFSVCGRSQAAAGELACAAAAGEATDPDTLARARADVSAEVVREYAWSVLLDWPRRIGEPPGEASIAAARTAEASRGRAVPPADADAEAIARAAFGAPADAWLGIDSIDALDRWIDEGGVAAARFMRRMRSEEAANDATAGGPGVPLLQGDDRRDTMRALWSACEADPAFAQRPTWHGAPAETGALARRQADPLVRAMAQRRGSRVIARFVARLRELAGFLAGRQSAAVGVEAWPEGSAAAWVENARGLLVHQVRLDGDVARSYRIVAPTEWNFHPQGALAAAFAGAPADDRVALARRGERTAHSLDPCVACRVEIEDA
jgi:hypothetical protein